MINQREFDENDRTYKLGNNTIGVRLKVPKVRKTTDGGLPRLRLTVPALPPEHLRSARREEPPGQDGLTINKPWKGDRICDLFDFDLL